MDPVLFCDSGLLSYERLVYITRFTPGVDFVEFFYRHAMMWPNHLMHFCKKYPMKKVHIRSRSKLFTGFSVKYKQRTSAVVSALVHYYFALGSSELLRRLMATRYPECYLDGSGSLDGVDMVKLYKACLTRYDLVSVALPEFIVREGFRKRRPPEDAKLVYIKSIVGAVVSGARMLMNLDPEQLIELHKKLQLRRYWRTRRTSVRVGGSRVLAEYMVRCPLGVSSCIALALHAKLEKDGLISTGVFP